MGGRVRVKWWATAALDLVGLGLIVGGVALVFVPAALVLAGIGALAVSWRLSRGDAA